MKKSLIALAVAAGTIAAAHADTTTLYGSLGFSSEIAKTTLTDERGNPIERTVDGVREVVRSIDNNHWNIAQTDAVLGVRGTEDLNNGLQAEFKFEVEAKSGDDGLGDHGLNGTKDAYVGLKGDFGKVTIGRQGSTWNVDEDYFESSKPTKELSVKPGRESKSVKYATPDFGGFKVEGRFVADGMDGASLGVDKWDTALAYEANGIKASAAYGVDYDGRIYEDSNGKLKVRSMGSTESMGAQVGYENDQFGVFGNVQHQSSANTVYNVQGKYMLDAQNTLRAGVGYDDTRDNNVDNYSVGLGYQYNFSDRTFTWVETAYSDATKGKSDGDFTASVGIRHDF